MGGNKSMNEEVFLCNTNEITEGKLTPLIVEGVLVMATKFQGKYLVASRICTHKDFDLTKGFYTDGYITCTLHTSTFELPSGKALNPPAIEPLTIYNTLEKEDKLYIILED